MNSDLVLEFSRLPEDIQYRLLYEAKYGFLSKSMYENIYPFHIETTCKELITGKEIENYIANGGYNDRSVILDYGNRFLGYVVTVLEQVYIREYKGTRDYSTYDRTDSRFMGLIKTKIRDDHVTNIGIINDVGMSLQRDMFRPKELSLRQSPLTDDIHVILNNNSWNNALLTPQDAYKIFENRINCNIIDNYALDMTRKYLIEKVEELINGNSISIAKCIIWLLLCLDIENINSNIEFYLTNTSSSEHDWQIFKIRNVSVSDYIDNSSDIERIEIAKDLLQLLLEGKNY